MSLINQLEEFQDISLHPGKQLQNFLKEGRKVIGVLPYYVPEELIHALGMIPMGIWGSNRCPLKKARMYSPAFYCTVAQTALELILKGTMDELKGIIVPTLCDTLRPLSQNIKSAVGSRLPVFFLAHPQNRFDKNGISFTMNRYEALLRQLEKVAGKEAKEEELWNSIHIYNESRFERCRFTGLAALYPAIITPKYRSAVLKASYFMEKGEYTEKLRLLNDSLEKEPVVPWDGIKIVTSGILLDQIEILDILEDCHIAIAADDVAHESRSFRTDAPEPDNWQEFLQNNQNVILEDPGELSPLKSLAVQFAAMDYDVLLYDRHSEKRRRAEHVCRLVKESGSLGLIIFLMAFCDPEEMEYPSLKKELEARGIAHLRIGIDQEMRDFSRVRTAIEAFSETISIMITM